MFGFLPKVPENFIIEGSFPSGFRPTVKGFCKEMALEKKDRKEKKRKKKQILFRKIGL